MRVLFTSDWHVDATTAGVSRFDELRDYVAGVVDYVATHEIDVVCFLGDAFDPGSMLEGLWSSFVIDAWHRLTTAARCGSVFIAGNHDVLDASRPMSTLSPLACTANLMNDAHALDNTRGMVDELPAFHVFTRPGDGIGVLALPYVSRAVERSGLYDDALERAFADARASAHPVIVIGHYSIPGIHAGSEEEMLRGRDLLPPTARIKELAPALVVNGHYHARQTVEHDGVRFEIVGAPARFTFGERDDGERGFLVLDI